MILLWIVLSAIGIFFGYHFTMGFIEGLGIRRKPRLRIVRSEEE
jgi:hypothetical protein